MAPVTAQPGESRPEWTFLFPVDPPFTFQSTVQPGNWEEWIYQFTSPTLLPLHHVAVLSLVALLTRETEVTSKYATGIGNPFYDEVMSECMPLSRYIVHIANTYRCSTKALLTACIYAHIEQYTAFQKSRRAPLQCLLSTPLVSGSCYVRREAL